MKVRYKLQRPYSSGNITERVNDWLASHGYDTLQSFSTTVRACASKISEATNR